MEVPRWRDELAGTRAAYVRELEARGFVRYSGDTWIGPITVPSAAGDEARRYKLVLPDDFPFSWPTVSFARTPDVYDWHLQPPGQLCLWRREDTRDRPWETVEGLFSRIRLWHERARNGWPGDEGDLDLDRYFVADSSYPLVTYGDLSQLTGKRLSREHRGDRWIHLVPSRMTSRQRRQATKWAFSADLGVLERPVWDWKTTLAAMRPGERAEVEKLTRLNGPGLLLLRYERTGTSGPQEAAAALSVTPKPDTAPELRSALAVAQDTPAARILRAGPDAARLALSSAAIIGCGAVGSFLTEMLAMSGVGSLVLVDPERLMPGNCIRHLAGPDLVPQFKVEAIKSILASRQLQIPVEAHCDRLGPELAFRLLTRCDIVIDCAADGGVTGLLEHLATVTGKIFIKAALHRGGGVLRVDRLGPGTVSERPEPIPDLGDSGALREAGCGDPISSTPPSAVIAAASAACRMTADTLQASRRRRLPDCMVEILIPQPDHPYERVGILL
jgi:molybdopterin/thiamine biosynthesis adenylyltransferase